MGNENVWGGIKMFRDYFDSMPTDGSVGMHMLWGLAITVIRQCTEWRHSVNIMCCGAWQ